MKRILFYFSLFIGFYICSCQQQEALSICQQPIHLSKGMKVSILGDSYSTFAGYLHPETNLSYYPHLNVKKVDETWWRVFLIHNNLILEYNNSFSGSTITKQKNKINSYIERCNNLGNPDVIFIFGGTNDDWQHIPLGYFQYESWQEEDLYYFRSAFAYMITLLQKTYPHSQLVNIINGDLKKEYIRSMEIICYHYNICNITLGHVEKSEGHPTKNGMYSIFRQLEEVLIKDSLNTAIKSL